MEKLVPPPLLLLILIVASIYACKNTLISQQEKTTPTLVDYSATPWDTKFSYYLMEGDTCQMATQTSTIYVWYDEKGDGVVLNVEVKHQ